MRDRFPPGVALQLGYYVYRLVDPRNGETFYVGKGKGDRVFSHASGEKIKDKDEDEQDQRLKRIRDIHDAGLEVVHVIHRHGMESEETALCVGAAVMDAYPGLTNRIGGHQSGEFGVAHAEELITRYCAKPFVPAHPLLLVSIRASYEGEGRDAYDAARYAWKINPKRAEGRIVVAHVKGLVKEVFTVGKWLEATKENFPELGLEAVPGRFGFVGKVQTNVSANITSANWFLLNTERQGQQPQFASFHLLPNGNKELQVVPKHRLDVSQRFPVDPQPDIRNTLGGRGGGDGHCGVGGANGRSARTCPMRRAMPSASTGEHTKKNNREPWTSRKSPTPYRPKSAN